MKSNEIYENDRRSPKNGGPFEIINIVIYHLKKKVNETQ